MASSLIPDYEVKLLLDPSKVLGPNNKLQDDVLSAFSIASSTKKMSIQFVDTRNREIDNSGWNLRIRKIEDEDELELTYKKRYKIVDGDYSVAQSKTNIDAALKVAEQEGFDALTTFEQQVEVGYHKQTLSLSYGKKIVDEHSKEMGLPSKEESDSFLANEAPNRFNQWLSENESVRLTDAIIYGPVHAKRYKGKWDGDKIFIEVWPIRKSQTDVTLEQIVEASFKRLNLQEALEGHAKLTDLLQKEEWLLAKDSLKTKLIMERYGETAMDFVLAS